VPKPELRLELRIQHRNDFMLRPRPRAQTRPEPMPIPPPNTAPFGETRCVGGDHAPVCFSVSLSSQAETQAPAQAPGQTRWTSLGSSLCWSMLLPQRMKQELWDTKTKLLRSAPIEKCCAFCLWLTTMGGETRSAICMCCVFCLWLTTMGGESRSAICVRPEATRVLVAQNPLCGGTKLPPGNMVCGTDETSPPSRPGS
jgi:hypothetical protein